MDISVIIPLAWRENAWQALLEDLRQLPVGMEILFVSSSDFPETFLETVVFPGVEVRRIAASPGRAAHMNAGAKESRGKYLWFLHADSRFDRDTLTALEHSIRSHPDALLYFDLAFLKDASPLVKLNEWGARFRSRVLKIPFGDQGFCIRKDLFEMIGGYPTDVPYGEDHIFVWRARRLGIAVKSTGTRLYTSARKYKEKGWLKVTLLNQYLWIRQAWQEWKKHRALYAK